MFLLKISLTEKFIAWGIVAVLLLLFILYKWQTRKKREESDLRSNGISKDHVFNSKTSDEEEGLEKELAQVAEEDKDPDPLRDLADELGIYNITVLKAILGRPLTAVCAATTAKEAEDAFRNAASDSEEEYVALLRWIELEDDLTKMEDLYDFARDCHAFVEKFAAEKWDILADKKVEEYSDEETLRDTYTYVRFGSEAEKKVIQKLFQIYQSRS